MKPLGRRYQAGYFYAIELAPETTPGRIKLGWASDVERRLRQHRKEKHSPLACVLHTWPCAFGLEKSIIRAATLCGCEHVEGETFDVASVEILIATVSAFLADAPDISPSKRSIGHLLRIPEDLLSEIRALAGREQRTVSGQIVYLLRRAMAR